MTKAKSTTLCLDLFYQTESLKIVDVKQTKEKLLLKRYETLPEPETGDMISVDDFAYKTQEK